MSKYVCGRCQQGFDDLHVFGEHACPGDNPVVAALVRAINVGEYSIDVKKAVDDAFERERIKSALDRLESGLRRGDLSA